MQVACAVAGYAIVIGANLTILARAICLRIQIIVLVIVFEWEGECGW